MLELQFLRNEEDRVRAGFAVRNMEEEGMAIRQRILELDDQRKANQTENDQLLSQIKSISAEIGDLFKSGKPQEANAKKSEVAGLKDRSKELTEAQRTILVDIENELYKLPNIPHESVKPGKGEEDNEVYQEWNGDLPDLGADALPHWDLADKYDLFSLPLGVKLTGAGFPVYRKKGSKLQRALINFFLDEASAAGYEEVQVPHLVNEDSARGTGQLPDKEGQMYYVEKDNLYLIPTAEVPVTNLLRGDLLQEEELPIKYTGYTPCFRREAGSYGADVKGLNRVHQFDKVEIVQVCHPDESYEKLGEMANHIESLLKKLELPYRILRLCGGDVTFASALTYDFEVFSLAQKKWLEVSSVSNFETFQTNRLKLRFKDKDGKNRLAHSLNGSALALPRIFASIVEKYQTKNGIVVPEVLRRYTGFDIID